MTAGAGPMKSELTARVPAGQPVAAPVGPAVQTLEPVLGNLARLAAAVCQAPFASIVLTDYGEAWFGTSEPLPVAVVPQHDPFFKYTARAAGLFEVQDTVLDERFRNTECVTGTLAVRSYAGCALRAAHGDVFGTLAVYGAAARLLSPQQRDSLMLLAEQGVAHVDLLARLAEQDLLGGTPSIIGSLDATMDSTDLVTARGNLRKAETLFHNTFDQAPIGIAYADRGGNYLRCNQALCTMLGFDPGELAGRSISDVTYGNDFANTSAELERLWNGEVDFVDGEKRYARKDGSALWFRTTTSLVREGNGTPEYSVEFLRDITARKESAVELERVHKQLMTASRQAGMAEVATNVLHNVGNILNSINISASLVAERVKQSKAPGISRIAALLREKGPAVGEFIASDERGKRIPQYLATLGEQLIADQQMALQEIASLRDNLEHIKDTVTMQQSYAKLCGVTETVAVVDLVEDSLRLNAGAFVRHGVTLCRDFHEVPPITVDKHKVLQILVNLVRNAKYACDESGRTDKLLTLRVEGAENGVRISVIDNGVGIPAQNMERLFSHGFTTRQSGHGFGLHSGALAAQELGGSLHAMSDGPGCGAAFILELPYTPRETPYA
jgi:PAS domain S-box-containing protein